MIPPTCRGNFVSGVRKYSVTSLSKNTYIAFENELAAKTDRNSEEKSAISNSVELKHEAA